MAYSKVVIDGDGSTKIFAVNFAMDYLLESDVTCRVGSEVDGGGNPSYRDITFISTNLLQVGGATPGNGVPVTFERTVDKDSLRVDYSDGDIMDEDNLDTSQKQLMMAVHELLDGRTGVQAVDQNLGGYKIINLGEPEDADDAATKSYVDTRDAETAAAVTAGLSAAVAATAADKLGTAADRVQTGLDVVSANASAASAAAMFDLFDDRWLGAKPTNPTLDNDGNALLVGELYWNSTVGELRVYSGSVWVAYSPTVGLSKVQDDSAPKLGGDLSLNGHVITGLVPGVNIQAYDATLINAAALATRIGVSIQAYDAETVKTNVTRKFTAQQGCDVSVLVDGASIAWNVATRQKAIVTLAGNRTMAAVTNAVEGMTYILWVAQDATGSRTLAYTTTGAGSFNFGAEGVPTLTTTASKVDALFFEGLTIGGVVRLCYMGIKRAF